MFSGNLQIPCSDAAYFNIALPILRSLQLYLGLFLSPLVGVRVF